MTTPTPFTPRPDYTRALENALEAITILARTESIEAAAVRFDFSPVVVAFDALETELPALKEAWELVTTEYENDRARAMGISLESNTVMVATTFQSPLPDNRRRAILTARYILDQVMELPQEEYSDAQLLVALAAVKRSANRVEKALRG